MKFEETKVYGMEAALKGMRDITENWKESDSGICKGGEDGIGCFRCSEEFYCKHEYDNGFKIGKKDMELVKRRIQAGPSHRKFLSQMLVSVEITAPLYWWREFEFFKVGIVSDRTGYAPGWEQRPITLDSFETEDQENWMELGYLIGFLEGLRRKYNETKDMKYRKELVRWLPGAWLQKRTVFLSYEDLIILCEKEENPEMYTRGEELCQERSLREGILGPDFESWVMTLPYAGEFLPI